MRKALRLHCWSGAAYLIYESVASVRNHPAITDMPRLYAVRTGGQPAQPHCDLITCVPMARARWFLIVGSLGCPASAWPIWPQGKGPTIQDTPHLQMLHQTFPTMPHIFTAMSRERAHVAAVPQAYQHSDSDRRVPGAAFTMVNNPRAPRDGSTHEQSHISCVFLLRFDCPAASGSDWQLGTAVLPLQALWPLSAVVAQFHDAPVDLVFHHARSILLHGKLPSSPSDRSGSSGLLAGAAPPRSYRDGHPLCNV